MKWYYESNGHPQGPILESELRLLKEEGKIGASCLIWREGMEDWAPLEKVREFAPAPKLKTAPEFTLPALLNTPPAPAPVAAPTDDDVPNATRSLKTAGTAGATPVSALSPTDTALPREDAPAEAPPTQTEETPDAEDRKDWAPKWENPGPDNPLLELLPSVVEILFSPRQVFERMNKHGGWGRPLAFLAILNALGTVMVLLTAELLPTTGSAFSRLLRLTHQAEFSAAMLIASMVGGTLVLPLTILFKAGVLHGLMRFGARSEASFPTTFRTACYAMGATSALWIVPLGAVWASGFSGQAPVVESAMLLSAGATGIWSMFVLLQALASSHGVALWRTALAVLIPPFVASILLGAAVVSAFSGSL